jgi:hypothetical protein
VSTAAAPPRRRAARRKPRRGAAVRRLSPRRGDALLLAAIVVVVVVFDYAYASRSYFFGDDVVILWQSRTHGLSLDYLTSPAGLHLAPGHRLISWAQYRVAGVDFGAALAVLLAFHAASVVLLQRVLAVLFGRVWWTFALAFTFGLSVFFMAMFWWWSPGLFSVPATAFSLASIHAYLWWWRTRRKAWLIWSVVAMCGALLFYEKAVLVPAYLVLTQFLLLAPSQRLSDRFRTVLRQWRVWLLYAAPVAVYLVVALTGDYYQGNATLPFSIFSDYMRAAWFEGFAPGVLGVRIPDGTLGVGETIAVYATQAVFVGAVVLSVLRRRSAWRAWAFLALGFLANVLVVGPRVAAYGTPIAYVTRYYTEIAYLVPIAVACAFAVPPRRIDPMAPLRLPRALVGAAAVAALGAYVALVAASDSRQVVPDTGTRVEPWVHRVEAGLQRARRIDARPALLDGRVPNDVVASFSAPPQNLVSAVIPVIDDRVDVNGAADRIYRIGRGGSLLPVAFQRSVGGTLIQLGRAGTATIQNGTWEQHGASTCVISGTGSATLQIQPHPSLHGHGPWWVRTRYSSPTKLVVATNVGLDYQIGMDPLPAAPFGGARLVRVETLPGPGQFTGIRFLIPVRACFTSIEIGRFRDAGGPI